MSTLIVVDQVNRGIEPFPGEADLARQLVAAVGGHRLRATTNYAEAVTGSTVVVVVVPLFVDDATWQPDFGWMDSAAREIAAHLYPRHACLVRDDPARRDDPQPLEADAGERLGTPARAGTFT